MTYRTSTRDAARTRTACLLALLAAFAGAAACAECSAATPEKRVQAATHFALCDECREACGITRPPRAPPKATEFAPALRRWMRWWTERNGRWV